MPKIRIPFIKEVFNPKRKRGMAVWGLLLAGAAPGLELWWLAWIALIPALMATSNTDRLPDTFWRGFWLGFAYHGLYCLWFFDLHPLVWMGFGEIESRLVTLAGWLLIAAEGGLLMGMLLVAYQRLQPQWLRLIGFPLLWVFGFSTLNWTPMALPWALLEYTQAGLWPLRGWAGLVSASGLTLTLMFHQAWWAQWLNHKPRPRWTYGLPLLIPGVVWLLSFTPAPAPSRTFPMPVAVVQAGLPIEVIRSGLLGPLIIDPAYLAPVRQRGFPPGTLVVYPEEGVVPDWVDLQAPLQNPMLRRLTELAQQKQLWIAVGVSSQSPSNQQYNSVALISPDSNQSIGFYHKRRLVPFGEFTPYGLGNRLSSLLNSLNIAYSTPYDPGPGSNLLTAGPARLGALVCFELIDGDPRTGGFAMQYRKQGANLLINTSNLGWFHQNPLMEKQFIAIGQIRAAESGLPLVISSNTGISAIIDAQGRILQQTDPHLISPHKSRILFYNEMRSRILGE